jgi:amidase
MADASINDLSAKEARRRIGTKEISPVELLEACVERIEAVDPAVNAICERDFDRARVHAVEAERSALRGDDLAPLHGLPVGVKDLEDTADLRTTYGSLQFKDHVPDTDEIMVTRVKRAGGIIFAKTNTPEFGAGANTRNSVWGATGNPFNPMLNAGGSSGGSAVALACGMMPLATGSDMGGSLRIPAAYCGVSGFRPTPGLVPTAKRKLGWSPLSVSGPMARSIEDLCMLLAHQAADDSQDPLATAVDPRDFSAPLPVDPAGLNVAWTTDFGFCAIDKAYAKTTKAKIKAIKNMFRACSEATPDLGDAEETFATLRALSFVASHRETYERDPNLLGPNVLANYLQGASMSLADVAAAEVAHTELYRRTETFFEEFDLLIGPTVPISPFAWEQLYLEKINGKKLPNYFSWLAPTFGITLTTCPAASIPLGLDEKGMPFGLQVIGPAKDDGFVLGAAHAIQQAVANNPDLARPVPDIAKLASGPTPELKSIIEA